MNLKFAEDLIAWYWKYGFQREDKYKLGISDWLTPIYSARNGLRAVNDSLAFPRPAFAVWGPSQTGKSMLVSAYFDRNAVDKRVEGEAGKNSALYWPGGLPSFFFLPEKLTVDTPPWLNYLNPFRQGKDASACLSRFTLGTLDLSRTDCYLVKNPLYPIELRMLTETELLHVFGRGYDTECLGPHNRGNATTWTLEEFRRRIELLKRKFPGKTKIKQDATELLIEVTETFDAFVFGELERFKGLINEGDENWKNFLAGLLEDSQLTSSLELVEALAADILWDSAPALTEAFRRLRNIRVKLQKLWGGRTIHCDLRVAALLLDMDSVLMAFDGAPVGATPQHRDYHIARQIPRLRYAIEGDRFLIGLSDNLPQAMNLSGDEFGTLQALVSEIVVPINPDFLPDGEFKRFLAQADLLDFPGVGGETNTKASKVNVGFGAESDTDTDVGAEQRKVVECDNKILYTRIVKRGKTSTLVSLYSRKLNIDGFNLFIALDGQPMAKAAELGEGIGNWWRNAAPDYFSGPRTTRSPLPLNIVLLWWAMQINQANPTMVSFMPGVSRYYEPLKDIADPAVSTFFALNYHKLPRGTILDQGRLDLDNSFFVRSIAQEAEFKRVFGQDPGWGAFRSMLSDRETGGVDYYFKHLATQLGKASRAERLGVVVDRCKAWIETSLTKPSLFPLAEVRDTRRETLELIQNEIVDTVRVSTSLQIAQIDHVLRELLNIEYTALKPVPGFDHEITVEYLRMQFASWITSQANHVDKWRRDGKKTKPDWRLLKLDSGEKVRGWLEVLVASLDDQLIEMVRWLRELVRYRESQKTGVDLRRVLAVRMGNALLFGRRPPVSITMDEASSINLDLSDPDNLEGQARGTLCVNYQWFIKPFVETRLPILIEGEGLQVNQRVQQSGDTELRQLCGKT